MERLHRYLHEGKRYVIDTRTCFCFECDDISWDVIEHYPHTATNRIIHLLKDRHDPKELEEVVGELEWLRATKAILPAPKMEEESKRFQLTRGLSRLTVAQPDAALLGKAGQLLLARSEAQGKLQLRVLLGEKPAALGDAACEVLRLARLAEKPLTVVFEAPGVPGAMLGHTASPAFEGDSPEAVRTALERAARADARHPGRMGKALKGQRGHVRLIPGSAGLVPALTALEKAGVESMILDLPAAFAGGASVDTVFSGLRGAAVHYAQRLLKGKQYRLEPIAGLFKRIYEGTPVDRLDPAGVNELAVDSRGTVYPSASLLHIPEMQVGGLATGELDADRLSAFEDLGVPTTAECMRCWARGLCGGGSAAIHHALSGSVRKPRAAWCDAQRAWLESAVAAFNLLSAEGVNFTRVYEGLAATGRPSLLKMMKAAFSMSISMRAIAEADAELLTQWENWSEAAYFLSHESSMFMATRYDREMDALHPRSYEQEFVLTRRGGAPMGLLKIRPELLEGAATLWLYLHDERDYAAEGVRRSLRFLLEQAGSQQALRRVNTPVGPGEDALAHLLEATGFEPCGAQREALFLHGRYQDVRLYTRRF